ncbi:MAG: 50S ribosomal protein L21 [Christensenellaceae bacterium]|jgi:large subunit ribosomal protein L21|nr:50S ribosomal protein L21 [Christensenellaceae bacterium]
MKKAIIVTGGKQYNVGEGWKIKVELLPVSEGDIINLGVIYINEDDEVRIGDQLINAYVKAQVIFIGRGPKINIFTYKAKKNVRRRQGHRQPFVELLIQEIVG